MWLFLERRITFEFDAFLTSIFAASRFIEVLSSNND